MVYFGLHWADSGCYDSDSLTEVRKEDELEKCLRSDGTRRITLLIKESPSRDNSEGLHMGQNGLAKLDELQ